MGRYLEKVFLAVPKFYDNVPAKTLGAPCVASGVIEKHRTTISIACNFRRIGDFASGIIAIIGKRIDEVSKAYNYTRDYESVKGKIKLLGKPVDLACGNYLYVFNMVHEDKSPWDAISKAGGTILSPGISVGGLEGNVVAFTTDEKEVHKAKKLVQEMDVSDFDMPHIPWYFQKEPPPVDWLAAKLGIPDEFGVDTEAISQTYGVELMKSFNIFALPDYLNLIARERVGSSSDVGIEKQRKFCLTPFQFQALIYMVQNPPKGRMKAYDEQQLGKALGVSRGSASAVRWRVIRKSLPLYYHMLMQYDPLSYLKSLTKHI